jgi:Ca2+/Na+ antiporter
MKTSSGVVALSLLLSLILFLVWLFRRRVKIKEERAVELEKSGSYTTAQVFGIIGIFVFMLPIFYIVMSNLAKGVLFLLFFLFGLIPFPKLIRSLLEFIAGTSVNFIVLTGTYLLCEFIWPQKIPSKGKDLV